jgi:protein SCO1/2
MTMTQISTGKRRFMEAVAKTALWVGLAAGLAACSEPAKPQFSSIDITGADYARDFTLTDHNGQSRSLKDFQGKVVVVFFGFTQCPDVCPTTMAELAQVKKMLGQDGDRLQGLFITVDPERDTQSVLKAYMANFDPTFLALRPELDKLPELAKNFKIFYKKVEGTTTGSYSLDHSAGNYIFDAQGRIRLYSRYGSDVSAMTSDIQLLLKGN